MDELIDMVEQLQNKTGNRLPKVAYYIQIALEMKRQDVKQLLIKAVKEDKLIWGRTPFTFWFATQLSDMDIEIIQSKQGWTIENS